MKERKFQVNLSSVDWASLHTEEDFRRAARELVPETLASMGIAMAEDSWDGLQQSLRDAGLNPNPPLSEKLKFLQQAGMNNLVNASEEDRQEVEEFLVRLLRERKQAAGGEEKPEANAPAS